MLRITRVSASDGSPRLRVEGRITHKTVAALVDACGDESAQPPVLDLSQVVFVDGVGVETLRALARRGARLEGCSPFLAELMRAEEASPHAGQARS